MSAAPRTERPRGALPVVLAAGTVGVVAVLAAGSGGAWSITDRFGLWGGNTPTVTSRATPPAQSPMPLPSRPPVAPHSASWLGPVLWALLVLVVLAVAFLVWRRLPRHRGRHEVTALGASASGQAGEPSAPVLREGVGTARSLLDQVADPTDAVLAAWVALEQAAERSGVPRRPADTPTEFTVEVLAATPADRRAVTTLLGLYHRARFGGQVGPEAVVEARRCLDALASSFPTFSDALVPQAPRPGGPPR